MTKFGLRGMTHQLTMERDGRFELNEHFHADASKEVGGVGRIERTPAHRTLRSTSDEGLETLSVSSRRCKYGVGTEDG